jgi:hypothetical protein
MRHFGPVIISKVCDNPTCKNVAPVSDPSASYTRQSVVTYTGSEAEFTYCSNRCVNEDRGRSSEAAENGSHYWNHVMAIVEDEERTRAAHMAEGMPTPNTYVFEGESFELNGSLPKVTATGIRCGCCKGRHSGVKAVKFCYARTREMSEEMEAEHAIEVAHERWLEERYAA